MQKAMILPIVAAVLLVCISSATSMRDLDAGTVLPQITFYHRFSAKLKEKARSEGVEWAFPSVTMNTPEYHQLVVRRDLARHGRKLATTKPPLTFFQGNITEQFFDGLHYALIDVGTPKVSHFVALDTGSDLFWLPCECKACAPASAPAFEGLPSLNVYTPSTSNTSKKVTCGSTDCSDAISACQVQNIPATGQCAYKVVYGSSNTSTSGTVYQDVLHLRANERPGSDITSSIVLGCGQTQTGGLIGGYSIPDGLIGLGRQPYSVPSSLAKSGVVGDSFSICFADDGSAGRIVFGDYGSSNISTTSFLTETNSRPNYFVGVDNITVGNQGIPVNQTILVDTGTSVTVLTTSVYNAVLASFSKQITAYKRIQYDEFDLCYATGDPQVEIPILAIELSGGATLPIVIPYFYLVTSNSTLVGFCMAMLDGGDMNILGANFMSGYKLIFNREQLTLGFEPSDCYSTVASGLSPAMSPDLSPVLSPGSSPVVSPVLAPIRSTSPTPLAGGPTGGATLPGSSAPRTSVSLPALVILGLLVNFLLY